MKAQPVAGGTCPRSWPNVRWVGYFARGERRGPVLLQDPLNRVLRQLDVRATGEVAARILEASEQLDRTVTLTGALFGAFRRSGWL